MNIDRYLFLLVGLLATLGCKALERSNMQRNSTQEPVNLVGGNWFGTIDKDTIFLTFIDESFENAPMLGGSAHITNRHQSTSYEITNGTHNRSDSVWFALYKILVRGRGDYVLKGAVNSRSIRGTFRRNDQDGKVIESGNWEVHKLH